MLVVLPFHASFGILVGLDVDDAAGGDESDVFGALLDFENPDVVQTQRDKGHQPVMEGDRRTGNEKIDDDLLIE